MTGAVERKRNIQSKWDMHFPNRPMPKDYVTFESKRSGIVRHEKKNENWIS